jgi:hypothetical protein
MSRSPNEEIVFIVDDTKAIPLAAVEIASLHFLERQHLQEWVLQQPEIIGDEVLIITFEFDQWGVTSGTAPRDRLDVLGLGSDGRLVVAELKRGRAPDTVDLQSIKYAAMASRFDGTQLARLHMEFLNRQKPEGSRITEDEAAEKIGVHVSAGLSVDDLVKPRIVILAESFSPTVTSSVVWLNEQSVDITLKQYKAYRSPSNETILTVSQFYPVAEVAAFEVNPNLRRDRVDSVEDLPEVEWTEEDLELLQSLPFPVPHAVMDLCAVHPGTWIGSSEVYEKASVDKRSGMGRLAGFGYSVRSRFRRANAPWAAEWARGGVEQAYYCLDEGTAQCWLAIRSVVTGQPETSA